MIVYKTINLENGKIYIGQDSKNNQDYLGSGVYICNAIKKYGKENFKKEVIDSAESKEDLNEKEKYWIKFYNCRTPNGYNLTDGGDGPNGYSHTEVAKKKIGEAKMGENNPNKRPEVREKMRRENNPMFGVHRCGENNPMFSKHHTVESIEKMRKFKTEEHKKKISKTLKGKMVGEKNPMFGKKRFHDKDTRKKIAETMKRIWENRRKNKLLKDRG